MLDVDGWIYQFKVNNTHYENRKEETMRRGVQVCVRAEHHFKVKNTLLIRKQKKKKPCVTARSACACVRSLTASGVLRVIYIPSFRF